MKFTPRQYAKALHQAISESAPGDQNKILDNFIEVLRENGDLKIIDEIEQEFHGHDRETKGIKTAHITSAHVLSSSEEATIIKELNAHLGTKVELKKKVDEGLLGGVVIKVDDQLIDASVKKQLNDLKNELIKESK